MDDDGTSARAMLLLRLAAEGACVLGDRVLSTMGRGGRPARAAVEGLVAYRTDGLLPRFIAIKWGGRGRAAAGDVVPEDEGGFSRAPTTMRTVSLRRWR